MSSSSIARWSVITILAFSCTALQISEERHSHELQERKIQTLPGPAQGIAMTLLANISTGSDDRFGRYVRCDAGTGTGLTLESCNNVLGYSATSDMMETWGYLDELPPGIAIDEELPVKLWSDDGLCTISTAIIGRPDNIAIASPLNVSDAARAVIERCVIGRRGIGGFAGKIGGNEQLVVAVEKFHPQVTCQGPLESDKESCGEILLDMTKTYSPCRFGRSYDRTADYTLPYSILSTDGKCELVIDTFGPSANANWNAIWQAAEAILAMCLRQQRTGSSNLAAGVFVERGLYVKFRDTRSGQSPSLAQNSSNVTTVLPANSSTLGEFGDAVLSGLSETSSLASTTPTGVGDSPLVLPFPAHTIPSS